MLAARALALARRHTRPLLARANATLSTSGASSSNTPPPQADTPKPATRPQASTSPSSSSAQQTETTASPNDAGSKTEERGRRQRRRIIRKRAPISLTNPRKWNPPVKPGSLPVYDEALKLIKEDAKNLKKELKTDQARVEEVEKALVSAEGEVKAGLEKELGELREKVKILEVQSEINLPWVRWYAANGMGASFEHELLDVLLYFISCSGLDETGVQTFG